MKSFVVFFYFMLFIYFVILGGVDDFIIAETKFINSEISALKYHKDYKNSKNRYVSLEFVENLEKKYREKNNKELTIIKNQEKRIKEFSFFIIIVSLLLIFLFNAGFISLLMLFLPLVFVFSKIYIDTGIAYFGFLFLPTLIIFISLIILFIKSYRIKGELKS